jgi:enolase
MMTLKPDFQQMSRKELRTYVLTHREDEEALRIYMARLHNETGVIRQTGGIDEEDFNQLEQLIRRVSDRNT